MGKRGPRPDPTFLRLANGRKKRDIPIDEPTPQGGLPDPPPDLTGPALEVWNRLIPELDYMGVVAKVHGDLIAGYCRAVVENEEAEKIIATSGLIVEYTFGDGQVGFKANPAIKIRNEAVQRMRMLAGEFGMTPATSVKATKVKKSDDPTSLGEFRRKRSNG